MGQHTGIIKVPLTTLINSPSLNHFNNLAEVRNTWVSFSAIPFLAKKKKQQLLLFIIQALVKAKCKGWGKSWQIVLKSINFQCELKPCLIPLFQKLAVSWRVQYFLLNSCYSSFVLYFKIGFHSQSFCCFCFCYFRGVDQLHLAVLHPRKLAVYIVSGMMSFFFWFTGVLKFSTLIDTGRLHYGLNWIKEAML